MIIADHFCKGNFKGHSLFNGFYDPMTPIISQIPYNGFFVEYNDERSGSFAPWSVLKGTGVVFVAGLIFTKDPVLENYDDIERRYLEVKAVVGDNIVLSPQCGFVSVEEGNCIGKETQWEEMGPLVSCRDFL